MQKLQKCYLMKEGHSFKHDIKINFHFVDLTKVRMFLDAWWRIGEDLSPKYSLSCIKATQVKKRYSFALFLIWSNLEVDKNNFIKAFKEFGNTKVNEKVMWIWNMIVVSCISWLLIFQVWQIHKTVMNSVRQLVTKHNMFVFNVLVLACRKIPIPT